MNSVKTISFVCSPGSWREGQFFKKLHKSEAGTQDYLSVFNKNTHNYTQSCIHGVQIFIYVFYISADLWKDGFEKVFTLRTTESVKKYADFSNRLIDSTCCSIWLVPFGYLGIKESGRKVSLCPSCGFYEPCQAWQNKKEEHKTESMHWGKSVMLKISFWHYFTFAALANCKQACCNSFYNAGELNFSLLCHKKVLLYDLNLS